MGANKTKNSTAYWEEEARRYAGNADFWREKCRELEAKNVDLIHWMRYIQHQTHIGHICDTASAAVAAAESPTKSPI